MSELATQIPIRSAAPADAPAIAAILGEAFSADPVMSWVFGGPPRPRRLFLTLARRVYLARGFGHIAEGAGATLWLPAGAKASLPLTDELALMAAVFRGGGFGALARGRKVGEAMAAAYPREPFYYLFAVGVRPDLKGKGLGGRLIREGLARADAAGESAYLENSNPQNTPFYQRLGFAAKEPLALPEGAPPLLAMQRSAKGAGW